MGISHEYHSAHGRARRSRAGTGLRLAGVIAAILLLSLAVTAILENGSKESEQPQTATSSGMAENILAPLPMQGAAADSTAGESGETAADSGSAGSTADSGAAAVTLENFGPARQTAGGYTVKAHDSSTIRQPSCGQVDLSYFADAAFLGDSLTVGFSDYNINLGGALICGYTGVGPDAIVNRSAVKSSTRGEEVALDVLAAAHPKKLYLLLGTNTLTTLGAADRFLAYYGQMLDLLRQTLGNDCVIYVQSIPPVRPAAAAEKPGLASDVIRSVNEQLALLAADKGCVYLDLWETFADGEGNLKEVLAAPDGIHFSAGNGYGAWVTYLRNHAKYSAANAWTQGSAYAANYAQQGTAHRLVCRSFFAPAYSAQNTRPSRRGAGCGASPSMVPTTQWPMPSHSPSTPRSLSSCLYSGRSNSSLARWIQILPRPSACAASIRLPMTRLPS